MKYKIITGDKAGDIVFINRITLYSDNDYPFTFKRTEFPVRHVFSMTINIAQGKTFSNVFIDLWKNVFTHGQLYVAISRVLGLKILIGLEETDNKVKNYVFKNTGSIFLAFSYHDILFRVYNNFDNICIQYLNSIFNIEYCCSTVLMKFIK